MKRTTYKTLSWLAIMALLAGIVLFAITTAQSGNEDSVLIFIEWKHHKRMLAMPSDASEDQIRDVSVGFTVRSFAMGNDFHCLLFGSVRIYVIEDWNYHMKGFEIVALDITSWDKEGKKERYYIHYPKFLRTAEINGTEFQELLGYYQWHYKKEDKK